MKISCPACNARYRIPDDRVKGKNRIFKVKCKRCGSTVRVRGLATGDDSGRQTMPFNLQMPEATPATPLRVWFVGIDGKQVGPLTEQEVVEHISAARLGADDLMWRKGFSAWTPVREVAPFQDQVAAGSPSATPPAGRKHKPRRAQTLELSASMIELLVKLDERTDHGTDADPAADSSHPPQLPDDDVKAESAEALPPLADEVAPPIPQDDDETAAVAPEPEPAEAIDAPPVDADELPPVVPDDTAEPVVADEPAAKAEGEAKASVATEAALEATTDRPSSKVNLPGQVSGKASKKSSKGKRGKRGRVSRRKTPAADDVGTGTTPSGKIASLSGGSQTSAAATATKSKAKSKDKAKGKGKPKAAAKAATARPTGAKAKGVPPKKKGAGGLFLVLFILIAFVAVGAFLGQQVLFKKTPERVTPQAVAAAPEAPSAVEPAAAPEPPPVAPVEPDAGAAAAVSADAGSQAADATAAATADANTTAADTSPPAAADAVQVAAAAPTVAEPNKPKAEPKRPLTPEEVERRKARQEARALRDKQRAPAKKAQNDDIDRLLARAKARTSGKKTAPPPPPPPPPPPKKKGPTEDDIDRLLRQAKKSPPPPVKKKAPPPPPAAKGGLTKKQVNAVASGARSKIMRCYFMHADVDGSETLKVELRIGGDGHVISARVKGKHSGDQVGSCVTTVVKKLRFPRSGGASSKHVVRYTVGG